MVSEPLTVMSARADTARANTVTVHIKVRRAAAVIQELFVIPSSLCTPSVTEPQQHGNISVTSSGLPRCRQAGSGVGYLRIEPSPCSGLDEKPPARQEAFAPGLVAGVKATAFGQR